MSFWNLFGIKRNSVLAIIDIGSSQVSGALVLVSKNRSGHKNHQIVFNTKVEISVDGELDFDRFDFEIIKAIKMVTHKLVRSGFTQPEKFVCFLASTFLVSQTKVINFSQDKQFVFTQKILEGITKREAEDFRARNEKGDQFQIIENKVMQIKLDGYEVAKPFDKKITKLSLAQFLSGSPVSQLNKIRSAIGSQSHSEKISFHSYNFAAFSTLRDLLAGKKNFIAVDIGGELTDVSLCMDGVLLENLSFPYGLNAIIRDTARSQQTFRAEAKSQLALYSEGRLQSRAKNIFEQSLAVSRQKWTSLMAEALSLMMETSVIPDQIILTGDTIANQVFVNWLKEGDFKKYMLSNNPFKVSYIDHSRLSDLATRSKTIKDTYLVFESMFLEKINN